MSKNRRMFTDTAQSCAVSFYMLDFCSANRAEDLRYQFKHG